MKMKNYIMKGKGLVISISLFHLFTFSPLRAQMPVYLDESKPIEQRIDDALSRMTLDEKIAVIHAQSKFSAPGVASDSLTSGQTTALMACVLTCSGMSGYKLDRPTTRVWPSQPLLVSLLRGIPVWPVSMARAWARRRSIVERA